MINFRDYPYFSGEDLPQLQDQLRQICSIRKDDITQIGTLPDLFMLGRKVGKIPASSTDVSADDRIGDINYTATFLYILINNSGTPQWRRVSLGVW